jgi:CelD/BcsL family acetyltransferase involved in cellulose biosynthesis
MKTRIITDWSELDNLKEEWNTLLTKTHANSIFLTWEWIQSWRAVVGDKVNLFIVIVRNSDNRLVGIVPFYQYHLTLLNLFNFKALRILADHATSSEYPDWIVSPDCESEVLSAITGALLNADDDWDLIWMPRVSGWSHAFERITTATKNAGMLVHSRKTVFSYIPLPKSISEYEARFSSKRRQQLKRNKRKLLSKPGVDILRCQNHSQLPEFTNALFDLHHQRRMQLNDPGAFIRKPAKSEFYKQFLPKALDNGWLRFSALTQDNHIQAVQVGYAYNGDFLQIQEGLNPDYVNGVGNVLRHINIEQCIEEGLSKYDFLGGFTEHKRRWGATKRIGYDLLIGYPKLKNKLLFLREIWPSGRYIKEHGLFYGN